MKRCEDMSHYKLSAKNRPCAGGMLFRKPGYYSQNAQVLVRTAMKTLPTPKEAQSWPSGSSPCWCFRYHYSLSRVGHKLDPALRGISTASRSMQPTPHILITT